MRWFLFVVRYLLIGLFSLFVIGVLVTAGTYLYVAGDLPPIDELKDIRFQVPLKVYSRDEKLIAEFGEKKREPIRIEDTTDLLVKAVLAAEDDRFFEHPGVDYQGILRAAFHLLRTGEKGQGGSTITMQVARNFFLSSEKTYLRKVNEIFLALKIERQLTKQEVLELYLNKIYLGHRSYGFGAAARVYYGKSINELDIAQIAMLAGLPKAPSRYNPIADPERAVLRRNYVLRRMYELEHIDRETFMAARSAPVSATLHGPRRELYAPYVAEMVRADMVQRYGDGAYTAGYQVFTTIDSHLQEAANQAVQQGLLAYDRRHGYRGPEGQVDLPASASSRDWQLALSDKYPVSDLEPALVLQVAEQQATVVQKSGEQLVLDMKALEWARKYLSENRRGAKPKTATEVLNVGDIVRIRQLPDERWELAQLPDVEGALVSLKPEDGALQALVGGFNFSQSKFNRAIQAERQPGSGFKPFIYAAALENGFTPASIINDAPVVFEDPGLESTWRPENYSGKFYGPTRLRMALTKSRNLVSIRLLRDIGIVKAIEYARQFGFRPQTLPRNLSLALGSGTVYPIEMARAYCTFANGGFLVEPYFIMRVLDERNEVLFQADPVVPCRECEEKQSATEESTENAAPADAAMASPAETTPAIVAEPEPAEKRRAPRILSPQMHYLMVSMMRDVILHGTGRRALSLGRRDLAGKTGTTNDQHDAWFSGYNDALVAVSWVGFDRNLPLGSKETGSRAALPMWIAFMEEALKGVPEQSLQMPPGLVTIKIDPDTGEPAAAGQANAVFEVFREENVPRRSTSPGKPLPLPDGPADGGIPDQLF
jgi:penicillin-binding protein 1A